MQLLCSQHQVLVGLVDVPALVPLPGSSLVALSIALPDGLAQQVMLGPLDADSPVVLSLQHLKGQHSMMILIITKLLIITITTMIKVLITILMMMMIMIMTMIIITALS